jgi:hypothetical protein
MGTADFNSPGGEFSETRGAKESTAIRWTGQRQIREALTVAPTAVR